MHSDFSVVRFINYIPILIFRERLFRTLIFWKKIFPVLNINPDQVESSFTKQDFIVKSPN